MELDIRIRELVAIGASVAANCEPCLKWHVTAALKNGVSGDEVIQAVETGKLVRRGAACNMDEFAASLGQGEVSPEPACESACGD